MAECLKLHDINKYCHWLQACCYFFSCKRLANNPNFYYFLTLNILHSEIIPPSLIPNSVLTKYFPFQFSLRFQPKNYTFHIKFTERKFSVHISILVNDYNIQTTVLTPMAPAACSCTHWPTNGPKLSHNSTESHICKSPLHDITDARSI